MLTTLLEYFDPYSHIRKQRAEATASSQESGSSLHWLPQYLALAAGVLLEPYLASYRTTGAWNFEGVWGRVLFALIIAVAIMPAVFRRIVDEPKPIIVLIAPIFTAGLGWPTLFGAAMRVVTKT